MSDLQQTGFGRVFVQQYGAGPGHEYEYEGKGRLTGATEPLGDVTPVRIPSPDMYDEFEVIDDVRGESGAPTSSLAVRLHPRSWMLQNKCPFDVQAHFGKCTTPSDFSTWNQAYLFERARFTSRDTDQLTALDEPDRNPILVTGAITARYLWYLYPMNLAEVGETETTNEIVAVVVDPKVVCGDCGIESDGTKRLYALPKPPTPAPSPGLPTEVLFSEDGGVTWEEYVIDTMAYDDDPSDMALMGSYLVVVSNDSGSLHYAHIDDLDSWTEVTTGFAVGGEPNAIFALNSTSAWICGDGGYIYKLGNPMQGVTVQSSGDATSENLLDIHACDDENVVAVGENGAIVATENGHSTWTAPAATSLPATTLRAVWVRTGTWWLVGADDGYFYHTKNEGDSFAQRSFPNAGTGVVYDFSFVHHPSCPLGFMAYDPGDDERGLILRTIDGGDTWDVLPDGPGAIPDNVRITCLATSGATNFVFAGGLGADVANPEDGILIIGA